MSISAQNTYSSIKPELRQGNRRSSDIEQQAYAAVGRRFATGAASRVRYVRLVLGAAASITVVMLVTLVALLTYDNIKTPHALKATSPAKVAPRAAAVAPAAPAKPVVIIDEKEEAPARPVVAPEPIPPLVLLAPEAVQASATPARLASPVKTPARLREHVKPAAAGKHVAVKAGKTVQLPALRKASRSEPRKAPAAVKRKVASARQHENGGALITALSNPGAQRRYLAQPASMLTARHAPRRRHLAEP
ncbi:hypothetical protein [Massilia genomosp. 1]|uniref:Alginate biosynthesis protein AlgP n=1 Tax=Massilia genomosp. 1 TaxID=2609280 RepID=A0ABX0MP82_9BURK|nr:hypothetical protein [Massilia genomosp. 1]NHZ64589.1 hypothetical protein [Massilia genomosp. 1]